MYFVSRMLIRNSISCFGFGKRAVICFKQHLNRNYVNFQTQFGVFMQQNHGHKSLINHCSCNVKLYDFIDLLSTTKCIQARTGCHQQHNILQLRHFSTGEKGKVTIASPALANEHWGPYLVSRIHNLEELSRFHGYSTLRWGLSIIVATLLGVYLFRDQLRDNVADEVADVASRSMGKSDQIDQNIDGIEK